MGEKLIIRYDEIGSFLFLEVCAPYAKQDSNEIGESVVARFNLETGEMESVEILFFESWLKLEGEIRIPVSADLWPADITAPKGSAPASCADPALTINYNYSGDILTIDQGRPRPGQKKAEIIEGVMAGMNAETSQIENLEIHGFKARLQQNGAIVLPIKTTLRPIKSAVTID